MSIGQRMSERVGFKMRYMSCALLVTTLALSGGRIAQGSWPTHQLSAQLLLPAETGKLPSFEVAAIKLARPDDTHTSLDISNTRIQITHYTLMHLIMYAFGAKSKLQVIGGPDWIDSRYFDVVAKMDEDEAKRLRAVSRDEKNRTMKLMMQSLLEERFQLRVARESRTLPVFALVQIKNGAKLTLASQINDHGVSSSNGHLTATAISMDGFADYLSTEPETGGRVVLNETGLKGFYDFKMNWTTERLLSSANSAASGPGLFTVLAEQLGLKLKSEKGPVEVVVVQSAQMPSAN